ncbi:MAG: IclR family transcriptional regulator C-terminal domain-containing protein [Spirochaetales bacterium]|nr:IclR family transcriptional regulator C-terminal domain-containing protein [Spirochaetales bacterium]
MDKSLLAFRPQEKIRSVLDFLDFVALTHNTITSKDTFLQELEITDKGICHQ